ncbi:MAG: hypothetical protein ACQESP_04600 [Candidatus Muiribacteriota bacterium]
MTNKKAIIFLFSLLLLNLSVNSLIDEKEEYELFDFFANQNFYTQSSQIYSASTSLTSMEKAHLLSDILLKMFNEFLEFDINLKIFERLSQMVKKYSDELIITGRIIPSEALKKLKIMSYQKRDIEYGYTPDLSEGIHASDILAQHQVEEEKKQTVHDKYIPAQRELLVKDRSIKVSNILGFDIKDKSYGALSYGQFSPDSNMNFVTDKTGRLINFGYHPNSSMSYDIKTMSWNVSQKGGFFGIPDEDYELNIKPVILSARYFFLRPDRLIPYAGGGLSYMRIDCNIKNTNEKADKNYVTPHIMGGVEYFTQNEFSYFTEIKYFISGSQDLTIRGLDYSVNPGKFLLHFGMRFYFDG